MEAGKGAALSVVEVGGQGEGGCEEFQTFDGGGTEGASCNSEGSVLDGVKAGDGRGWDLGVHFAPVLEARSD